MLVFLITGLLFGAAGFYFIGHFWGRFRLHRRFRRGIKAEAKAERILRAHGFQMTSLQQPIKASLFINERRVHYQVRPDGFARKRSSLFAVEVKSGAVASNPMFKETRRQMLEYYHNSPVDGVLLVNADSETVETVRFESRTQVTRSGWLSWVAAFCLGMVVMWLIR